MARKSGRRKVKKDLKTLTVGLAIALVISLAILFYAMQTAGTFQRLQITPQIAGQTDLSTDGFVEVEAAAYVVGNQGAVSLRGGCYDVTASTEAAQAQSILSGIEGVINVRPTTHDVMKETFESLGIEVVMAKVVSLEENNFIGRLILKQGNTILSLDSKPSDGIALAVRTNTPIYFNETLLKERGENICP